MKPDSQILKDILVTPMPFGKYKGRMICNLPTYYLEWFSTKGFPGGKLGMMLQTTFVIKTEGLDYLLKPIKESIRKSR